MGQTSSKSKYARAGLTWSKVWRFIILPFFPSRLEPFMAVKKFEDIPIDELIKAGLEGVLLDADGTLGTHHTQSFPDTAVAHALKMAESGLKVAIFTNSSEDRFQQFEGIPVVGEARPKPDPQGFEEAMKTCLQMNDPEKVCMIGDNFITDGGAVLAGMRFIHVFPVKGGENPVLKATRFLAHQCARFYFGKVFNYDHPGNSSR